MTFIGKSDKKLQEDFGFNNDMDLHSFIGLLGILSKKKATFRCKYVAKSGMKSINLDFDVKVMPPEWGDITFLAVGGDSLIKLPTTDFPSRVDYKLAGQNRVFRFQTKVETVILTVKDSDLTT